MNNCPLCHSENVGLLFNSREVGNRRHFLRCDVCDLVFVPRRFHLSEKAEKERYLQHNNAPDDQGYRDFLLRLFIPLRERLSEGASGLDYGAGPGPALAMMMRDKGFNVQVYDPYFHPDELPLFSTYDFITCTETAEHFARPRTEFDRFQALLRPSGWLGIMTGMLGSWQEFPAWYYQRDPTHISFFSRTTMRWIGGLYGWGVCFPRQNVVLFQKSETYTL